MCWYNNAPVPRNRARGEPSSGELLTYKEAQGRPTSNDDVNSSPGEPRTTPHTPTLRCQPSTLMINHVTLPAHISDPRDLKRALHTLQSTFAEALLPLMRSLRKERHPNEGGYLSLQSTFAKALLPLMRSLRIEGPLNEGGVHRPPRLKSRPFAL